MRSRLFLLSFIAVCVVCHGCLLGCFSPAYEARQLLTSPAGQKLVDKLRMAASAEDPEVEFYVKHSVGARALNMNFAAASEGEVTEDERGTAIMPPVDDSGGGDE